MAGENRASAGRASAGRDAAGDAAASAGDERVSGKRRRRRSKEPLEVELTVSFRFGEEAEDWVTPIRQRKLPMVNSVFASRDRILRAFVSLMLKTGLSTPKVAAQILPAARLLGVRKP